MCSLLIVVHIMFLGAHFGVWHKLHGKKLPTFLRGIFCAVIIRRDTPMTEPTASDAAHGQLDETSLHKNHTCDLLQKASKKIFMSQPEGFSRSMKDLGAARRLLGMNIC
ncbi:hypothetical protein ACJX0J_037276, partial [Zea mays]